MVYTNIQRPSDPKQATAKIHTPESKPMRKRVTANAFFNRFVNAAAQSFVNNFVNTFVIARMSAL